MWYLIDYLPHYVLATQLELSLTIWTSKWNATYFILDSLTYYLSTVSQFKDRPQSKGGGPQVSNGATKAVQLTGLGSASSRHNTENLTSALLAREVDLLPFCSSPSFSLSKETIRLLCIYKEFTCIYLLLPSKTF